MSKSDIGRSMIEMIGVLAIVGVLSVGGIVGFNKAMRTYQMTKAATEYSEFIRDLMQFREALQEAARLKGQNGVNVGLTSVISEIGIMPKKWVNRNGYIVDSTLHTTTVTSNGFNFTINYELKNKNPIAWNGNIEEYCRLLFTYVIIPYQDVLKTVWVHRYGDGDRRQIRQFDVLVHLQEEAFQQARKTVVHKHRSASHLKGIQLHPKHVTERHLPEKEEENQYERRRHRGLYRNIPQLLGREPLLQRGDDKHLLQRIDQRQQGHDAPKYQFHCHGFRFYFPQR